MGKSIHEGNAGFLFLFLIRSQGTRQGLVIVFRIIAMESLKDIVFPQEM